jgi:lipopolysaccharide export system protein LptC
MTLPRWLPGVVLLLLALATGWMVWKLRVVEAPAPLYGPPRSDYLLVDYELVSLDDAGAEAFRVSGPRLARHPHLGTLEVEQPRFLFPDSKGGRWNARADRAWVAQDGNELRLIDNVEFDGPPSEAGGRIEVRTSRLSVLPEQNVISNEVPVTVTGPGSILRGRGLRAEMDTRRFQLSQVTGRYAPSTR